MGCNSSKSASKAVHKNKLLSIMSFPPSKNVRIINYISIFSMYIYTNEYANIIKYFKNVYKWCYL